MEASEPRVRHRRPKGLIVTLVVLILVGGVVGGLIEARRYQPLFLSQEFEAPGHGVPRIDQTEYGDGEKKIAARFSYVDGADVYFGFTMTNRGPFAVNIKAIPLTDSETDSMIRVTEVRVGACCKWDAHGARPFATVTLQAGRSMRVIIRVHLSNCEYFQQGGGNTLEAQPIEFSFLGMSRVFLMPIQRLNVTIPSTYRCPRKSPYQRGTTAVPSTPAAPSSQRSHT